MSSTCIKDETPANDVTRNSMDESAESDNFSDSDYELDDTSSVEDQKVSAVVAVIDTSTEDPASRSMGARTRLTTRVIVRSTITKGT